MHGTSRKLGVPGHAGSIYQWTCNRHRSIPDSFATTIPRRMLLSSIARSVTAQVTDVLTRVGKAERPVILAGSGVRLAGALTEFEQVIRALRIPVVTAWTHDLIASDDELFCGRPGTIGERAGNFTVQNSDLLLVLGSRLNIRQTSYNWDSFARFANKIQVDVDPAELRKPLHRPDVPICCDVKPFLAEMASQLGEGDAFPIPRTKNGSNEPATGRRNTQSCNSVSGSRVHR